MKTVVANAVIASVRSTRGNLCAYDNAKIAARATHARNDDAYRI